MTDSIIRDFLANYAGSKYPEDFLKSFEPIECLAHNQMGETLLIRHRETDETYIAKCYTDKSLLSHTTENELLKELHHDGLPAFIGEYNNDNMLCVVREYAKGLSLDQFVQSRVMTTTQLISFGVQLCNILSYLHSRTPPIIHRDIKPQNIVVNENGKVKIIDFGISRIYNKNARSDTVFFGTQAFSPPEQYGFSQTDSRSDIFSLGIVLCWMLTRETDPQTAISKIENRAFARIVGKCTAFAPKDRYANAAAVRKALLDARPEVQKKKHILYIAAGVLVIVLCVAGGLWLHAYNNRNIFTENHVPAFVLSEGSAAEASGYLNKKHGTDYFTASDDIANMGYMRQMLVDVYGLTKEYAFALPPENQQWPEENKNNFYPWGLPETEHVEQEIVVYTVVKILWPDVVTDYSVLKDDNGEYPGVRVAMIFAEKNGILEGANRPGDLTCADIAYIVANAEKVKDK